MDDYDNYEWLDELDENELQEEYPRELGAECRALFTHIKEAAIKSAENEISAMREELASLREIKEQKEEWEKEKIRLRLSVDNAVAKAKSEVRRERIKDLFHDSLVTAYSPKCEPVKYDCPACNNTQKITFHDSLGRKYEVNCECWRKNRYTLCVQEAKLIKLVDNINDAISRYYQPADGGERWVYKDLSDDVPVDQIRYYSDAIFASKERCQEYCDYINQKNKVAWANEDK